ncbi:MAG: hypothetical protein SAJ11_04605, partial [Jaaginema sp. PMC 1078.18]|nr:hypothetical protein [Jaaginema sp. PMC 1078.18]
LWHWGGKIALALLVCLGAGAMGWFAGKAWINAHISNPTPTTPTTVGERPESELENAPETLSFPPTGDLEPEPNLDLSSAEQERQSALRDRRLSLGIDYEFFTTLVDLVFGQRYPDQNNRELTNSDADASWRSKKAEIANEMLNQLTSLSSEARFQLGNYDRGDRQSLIRIANELHLSSRALYDLTDGAFERAFPDWADRNSDRVQQLSEPIGQVWQAFMTEQVRYLENGMALQEVQIAPGTSSDRVAGTLQPGEGQAIIAQLTSGQVLDLFLNANPDILISFYSPSGNQIFLEDARDRSWTGNLPESGYYEITLVSTSPQPLDYNLSLSVSAPLDSEENEF